MSDAATGELQFIDCSLIVGIHGSTTMNGNMYWDILKQSMIPSLQRLGRRAVFHRAVVLESGLRDASATVKRVHVYIEKTMEKQRN